MKIKCPKCGEEIEFNLVTKRLNFLPKRSIKCRSVPRMSTSVPLRKPKIPKPKVTEGFK